MPVCSREQPTNKQKPNQIRPNFTIIHKHTIDDVENNLQIYLYTVHYGNNYIWYLCFTAQITIIQIFDILIQ